MSDDLDLKTAAKIGVPIMLACFGYIGFSLSKDDPDLTTKRFVGGVITAGFVAWGVNTLLLSLGTGPDFASVCGAVIGSQGPAGAYLLVNKVKRLFEVK
jgi:hypothetical protein